MILQDILELGFKEKKEWFFEETKKINYILQKNDKTFRATFTENNGEPYYFQVGIVISEKGHVDRWRDVCSNEHLNKLINE